MLKFKVGDKVEITDNTSSHNFKLGSIVEIIKLYPDLLSPHYYAKDKSGRKWYINDKDIVSTEKPKKLHANIVDHIGSKVTVYTKDGNVAENRTLHTVDEFGLVIDSFKGNRVFIPWIQVKYVDYVEEV